MQKSRKILRIIRTDSRTRLTEISKRTGMPVTTVHRQLKKLEKNIIKRYVSIVEPEKIGVKIRSNFFLNTDKTAINEIQGNTCINNLCKIGGRFNYYIEAFFDDFSQLERFKNELKKNSKKLEVHYITEELKKESFLSNDPGENNKNHQ